MVAVLHKKLFREKIMFSRFVEHLLLHFAVTQKRISIVIIIFALFGCAHFGRTFGTENTLLFFEATAAASFFSTYCYYVDKENAAAAFFNKSFCVMLQFNRRKKT